MEKKSDLKVLHKSTSKILFIQKYYIKAATHLSRLCYYAHIIPKYFKRLCLYFGYTLTVYQ